MPRGSEKGSHGKLELSGLQVDLVYTEMQCILRYGTARGARRRLVDWLLATEKPATGDRLGRRNPWVSPEKWASGNDLEGTSDCKFYHWLKNGVSDGEKVRGFINAMESLGFKDVRPVFRRVEDALWDSRKQETKVQLRRTPTAREVLKSYPFDSDLRAWHRQLMDRSPRTVEKIWGPLGYCTGDDEAATPVGPLDSEMLQLGREAGWISSEEPSQQLKEFLAGAKQILMANMPGRRAASVPRARRRPSSGGSGTDGRSAPSA